MRDIVRALTTIPATDCNFKSALGDATNEQIETAINEMRTSNGQHKTRIATCERELKRRNGLSTK